MEKDKNLPNKNIYSNNSSGKPLPSNSNYSRNQSPYNSSYRGRSPERGNSRNFSQNRYSRSISQINQNNYSQPNSNTTKLVSGSSSHSNPRNRHYSNNRSGNSSYNRNRNYSHNRNRSYSSSTPKHQRHINQVQTNEETTLDPPGIDDTGSNELQLNHINCESSDTESDTEKTISVNMITVKNDYEAIIFEQPFTSHLHKNQLELLHNYYIGPIKNTQTTQE